MEENNFEIVSSSENVFISLQQDGIVIVDTPGVQGGNSVDMILQQYLSKAFGFIYVINTNIAGGVQHNRVRTTLSVSPSVSLSMSLCPSASHLFIWLLSFFLSLHCLSFSM